jgi:peptidoglycan/LPS O-acetylase OafA/YrhL
MVGTGEPAPVARTLTGQHENEHRPALDGLRALAVVAVLLFHLGRLPGGNLGVDAFFVLSGWLITWRLLAEADRSPDTTIRLRRFWSARVRRLMPASVAVIVTVAVVWPLSGIAVPSLRHDLVWALSWSSNWGTISTGGDYWARFGEPSPIAHFWSLAIEEQFYLVWPLVVIAMVRLGAARRRAAVGITSAILALASIAFMVASFDAAQPTATYMNTFARAHSLLIGAVAAAITVAVGPRLRGAAVARRAMPVAATVAVAIVVVSSQRSTWLFSWGFPVFAVAMAVVVVAAADGAGVRVLGSGMLRWIGDRSYGIYLWHWPVFLLLSPDRSPVSGVTLDAIRVAVSIGLAAASYQWLETPIRRRRRLGQWWAPGMAVGAVAASLAVVMIALPTAGSAAEASSIVTLPPVAAPSSSPPTAPPSADTAASTSTTGATNFGTPSPSIASARPVTTTPSTMDRVAIVPSPLPTGVDVPTGPPTSSTAVVVTGAETVAALRQRAPGPIRVLVAGDSTALNLADALLPYAAAHPDLMVAGNASFPGCGLTASTDGRLHEFSNRDGSRELIDLSGCTQEWASITARVGSPEQIDVVLVQIGAWDGVDIHFADGRVASVADPLGRQTVVDAYTQFVTEVQAAGAQVVWVTPPDIQLQWGAIDAPVNDPRRWVAMRQIIDQLPIQQIDLRSWLTAQGLDGPDGRPDGVHLADDVNQRFVTELVAPALIALTLQP